MEQQLVAPLSAGLDALGRAVERASGWLLNRYGEEVEWAIEDQFLIGLDDQERIELEEQLQTRGGRDQAIFFANAMSCLLAQGRFEPGVGKRNSRSFSFADKLLGPGGLLLEVTERRWLEALVGSPLQLYRIGPGNGRIALEEVTSRVRVLVKPHPAMESLTARGESPGRAESVQAPVRQGPTRKHVGPYVTEEQRCWTGCMDVSMQRDCRHGPLRPGDLVGTRIVTLDGEEAGRVCGIFGFPAGARERDLVELVEAAATHPRSSRGEILGIADVVVTAWLRSFLPDGSTRGPQAVVDCDSDVPSGRRILQWPVSGD